MVVVVVVVVVVVAAAVFGGVVVISVSQREPVKLFSLHIYCQFNSLSSGERI